jgi:cell division protein FtsB
VSKHRFIALLALAIAAAGSAFVTHLALRFQNVALGYKIQEARTEAAVLRERANQLRIELAARRAPAALAEMGRAQLGMVEADRVTTIVAGGGTRPARLSGRAR